jgi:MFS superfamily sulfate permease-like transporter
MTEGSLIRHPSAFLPVAMSLAALVTVIAAIAFHGTAPQPDEGAAAHLWQLLMAAQVPVIAFFAFRWGPRAPRPAIAVLALQVLSALAAAAPVVWLNW